MGCLARDVNPPKIILLLSALIRGEREEARLGGAITTSGRAKAQCIFCLTMSMGVHIVFETNERLDWGVPPHAEGRGKPRLRRSFALPAPGLTYPKILSSLPDCGLSDAPLKLPGVFADQKGELLCHLEIEGTVQRFL